MVGGGVMVPEGPVVGSVVIVSVTGSVVVSVGGSLEPGGDDPGGDSLVGVPDGGFSVVVSEVVVSVGEPLGLPGGRLDVSSGEVEVVESGGGTLVVVSGALEDPGGTGTDELGGSGVTVVSVSLGGVEVGEPELVHGGGTSLVSVSGGLVDDPGVELGGSTGGKMTVQNVLCAEEEKIPEPDE